MIPAPAPRDEGSARSADGVRIAWRRYGTAAPAVLVVPTWNLVDSRVVGHQVVALAPHATVITYDPRGAGTSERPPSGYDFARHAEDALAVLDATGAGRAAVLTASRGLNAAVLLATAQPQRVERIAAVAPYMNFAPDPPRPDPARLESLRTDWSGFIEPFMHLVFTEPGSEEVIAQMIAIGLEASPEAVATQETEVDWRTPARRLADVACPVLIVHGEADAAVPVSLARQIAATLPDARLELIAGGGHRPDIRSPELVDALLLEFLLGAAGQLSRSSATTA